MTDIKVRFIVKPKMEKITEIKNKFSAKHSKRYHAVSVYPLFTIIENVIIVDTHNSEKHTYETASDMGDVLTKLDIHGYTIDINSGKVKELTPLQKAGYK